MPEYPDVENNCDNEGIFSPVAGILGTMQANEVLTTILDLKNDLKSLSQLIHEAPRKSKSTNHKRKQS